MNENEFVTINTAHLGLAMIYNALIGEINS